MIKVKNNMIGQQRKKKFENKVHKKSILIHKQIVLGIRTEIEFVVSSFQIEFIGGFGKRLHDGVF